MKALKKKLLNVIADAGKRSAIKAAGAASMFCYHQAKEPECLSQLFTDQVSEKNYKTTTSLSQ